MRASRGPGWPTHKQKRVMRAARRNIAPEVVEPRQMTTQEMARDLVKRELASPLILGHRKPPRQSRDDRGQE